MIGLMLTALESGTVMTVTRRKVRMSWPRFSSVDCAIASRIWDICSMFVLAYVDEDEKIASAADADVDVEDVAASTVDVAMDVTASCARCILLEKAACRCGICCMMLSMAEPSKWRDNLVVVVDDDDDADDSIEDGGDNNDGDLK